MEFKVIEINNYDCCTSSYDYQKLDKIEIVCYENITYDSFFCQFMVKNVPCIIKNVSNAWDCTEKWIKKDEINYEYLSETYASEVVPVADCDKITFNSQIKDDISLNTYIQYLCNTNKKTMLYLKDWHLKRSRANDNFYEVPVLFASDWLNEYALDNNEDDYMFVYIGPQCSWTPLHADVYSSYSWSVNVIGRKKWLFFPPGEEILLKDSLGNLPLLYDKTKQNIKCFEVIQEKGDAIFVPSGWYHQVENLMETVSINHNWINGCNIQFVWKALLESLRSVEKEISDLKNSSEYSTQCQIILKSLFGMNFETFTKFLLHIGKKRLSDFNKPGLKFGIFQLGKKHVLFDLKSLLKVFDNIIHFPNFFDTFSNEQLKKDFLNIHSSISATLLRV